jgi:hypothetical protein
VIGIGELALGPGVRHLLDQDNNVHRSSSTSCGRAAM